MALPVPDISVVIPARNEAASLADVVAEAAAALEGRSIELIVVDDGSDDATQQVLAEIGRSEPRLRAIRHAHTCGKSGAIWAGAQAASGALIVNLDGDGQNDPAYLDAMLAPLARADVGLVAGQRTTRHDGAWRRWGSCMANAARRGLLRDGTRDTACGLKAYRRAAFLELPYFEGLHRFLPAMIAANGWEIAHVDVVDRPRRHGTSKYGLLDRLAAGILDIIGVVWLIRRRARHPARAVRPEQEGRK